MVRINESFALKQIVDDYIVVATGDKAVKFTVSVAYKRIIFCFF